MIKEAPLMWRLGINFFWLTIFLSACGSPPLAQPEDFVSTAQDQTLPPTVERTTTMRPTPIITQTTSLTKPVEMPALTPSISGETYEEVRQAGSVTVGDYTFGLPQKVTVTGLGRLLDIEGWLPDAPDEIIGISDDRVVGINVYNGKVRYFSHASAKGIKPGSVTALTNDRVAFLTFNSDTKQATSLWVSGADQQQAQAPIFSEPGYDQVATYDHETLILYGQDKAEIKVLEQNGAIQPANEIIPHLSVPLSLLQIESQAGMPAGYHITPDPTHQWLLFDSGEKFYLIDNKTGTPKELSLDKDLRAMALRWSPDGQKVAALVTKGPAPISYTELFILETEQAKTQKVNTKFQYITNITWRLIVSICLFRPTQALL